MTAKTKNFACLVLAGGLMAAAPSFADIAKLQSPAKGAAIDPDGAIVFTLSDRVPADMLNRLFVEFDGADVTGLVAMNGMTVTYQPAYALAPGDYTLKIYEQKNNGSMDVRESWNVRVAGGEGAAGQVYGNFEGQYNYLLDDNLREPDKIKPHTGSAVASVTAKTGAEKWDASAIVNGFYDSKQSNNLPDEENFMLGEYLLQGRSFTEDMTMTLRLGNHDTGVSNLLTDQYYRRGASAQADIAEKLLITGFSQDPARAIGVTNISGVGSPEQRASGIFAKYMPFENYGEKVFIDTGYYTGMGTIDGVGEGAASDPDNKGQGWVIAGEGQTQNDKFNLRGEFAETVFNEDGPGPLAPEHDKGTRLRARFAPLGDLNVADANGRQWTVTALYNRFGTFFRSLTNTGIPQDEERLSLLTDFSHESLSVNGEIYSVENNVDDIGALPTDDGFGYLVQASVMPFYFNPDINPDSWLGRTTFTAGGSYSDEQRETTPAGFLGDDLNQATWTANAGWSTAYDRTNLTFSYTYSDFDNEAARLTSYKTHFADLSMTCAVTDWLTVTPALQAEVTLDATEESTEKYFVSIDTATTIIPEKLTNTFHYSTLLDDGTADNDTHSASTEFVYQFNQPTRNAPGYAVGLSGYYENENTDGGPQDEQYKIFLSFKVSAPFGL